MRRSVLAVLLAITLALGLSATGAADATAKPKRMTTWVRFYAESHHYGDTGIFGQVKMRYGKSGNWSGFKGVSVKLQRKTKSGGWSTIGKQRTSQRGGFGFAGPYGYGKAAGRYRVKVFQGRVHSIRYTSDVSKSYYLWRNQRP